MEYGKKMELIKITTTVAAKQKFLPTKRHKKVRERSVKESFDVFVRMVESKDAPIAYEVTENQKIKEYRLFENELYKKRQIRYEEFQDTKVDSLSEIISGSTYRFQPVQPEGDSESYYEGESIITWTDLEENKKKIKENAEQYLILNDIVWIKCAEPIYTVGIEFYSWTNWLTFSIKENHNQGLYFNQFSALQRDEAVAYAKGVVDNYKIDSDAADKVIEQIEIKVLIPEAVKCEKPGIKNCGNCQRKDCTKGLQYSCSEHLMISEKYPLVYVVGYDIHQIMKKALRANVIPVNIEMLANAYEQPNLNSTKMRIAIRNQMLNNCSAVWVFEGDLKSEDRYEKWDTDTTAENEFKEAVMKLGIPIYYLEDGRVFPDEPAIGHVLRNIQLMSIGKDIEVRTYDKCPESMDGFIANYVDRKRKSGLMSTDILS